jgi:hypothetical protein
MVENSSVPSDILLGVGTAPPDLDIYFTVQRDAVVHLFILRIGEAEILLRD